MKSLRRRATGAACFTLLAILAEVTARAITRPLDRGFHVAPLATTTTRYYPFLLAGMRAFAAVIVAIVALRAVRAHAAAAAAERVLGRIGRRPRFRVRLSLRLWAYGFAVTALFYLVQNDAVRLSTGRWPLLAPWLHTYALPVFAVCSLLLALAWSGVRSWLADVERYAATSLARASRLFHSAKPTVRHRRAEDELAPRRLHGVVFESRPPPLPA